MTGEVAAILPAALCTLLARARQLRSASLNIPLRPAAYSQTTEQGLQHVQGPDRSCPIRKVCAGLMSNVIYPCHLTWPRQPSAALQKLEIALLFLRFMRLAFDWWDVVTWHGLVQLNTSDNRCGFTLKPTGMVARCHHAEEGPRSD